MSGNDGDLGASPCQLRLELRLQVTRFIAVVGIGFGDCLRRRMWIATEQSANPISDDGRLIIVREGNTVSEGRSACLSAEAFNKTTLVKLFHIAPLGCDVGWSGDDDKSDPPHSRHGVKMRWCSSREVDAASMGLLTIGMNPLGA
jgi:hypothetical protein